MRLEGAVSGESVHGTYLCGSISPVYGGISTDCTCADEAYTAEEVRRGREPRVSGFSAFSVFISFRF